MHRSLPHTVNAWLLLALFVMGGVAAPFVHRVEHGLIWAELRGHCDHSRHGDRLEASVPALHDDLCLLCQRTMDGTAPVGIVVVRGLEQVSFVPPFVVQPRYHFSTTFLIRGPPLPA